MNNPLLTIAIPTWNRGSILKYALRYLLPQIEGVKGLVEIVISDNGSSDTTPEIIKNYVEDYKHLNIVHFRHHTNTGYYGNFSKCRELSNGKFFWLLSDNDFLAENIVDYIIKLLRKEPSFIFLRDWSHSDRPSRKKKFKVIHYSVEEGIRKFNYKTTLISSVIFFNNKSEDNRIFRNFNGNTFIGFMFFLKSLDFKKNAYEILGNSLYIKETPVSFNAFKSFAIDLMACMNYARENDILKNELIHSFVNSTIRELTIRQYIAYRIFGKIHGKSPGKKYEVDLILEDGFSEYSEYQKSLKPLQRANKLIFILIVLKKYSLSILKHLIRK